MSAQHTEIEQELGHEIMIGLLYPIHDPDLAIIQIEEAPDGSLHVYTQARYLMAGDSVLVDGTPYPVRFAMGWERVALGLGENLAVALDGRERMELALIG